MITHHLVQPKDYMDDLHLIHQTATPAVCNYERSLCKRAVCLFYLGFAVIFTLFFCYISKKSAGP